MDAQRVAQAVGYFIRLLAAMKNGVVGERTLMERFLRDMGIQVEITGGYYRWPGPGKGIHGSGGGQWRREEDRYTKAELAEGLGYSVKTIDDWIRKGLLTPYRVNHKTVHFSKEEALALVRTGRAPRQSDGDGGQEEVGQTPGRKPSIEQG